MASSSADSTFFTGDSTLITADLVGPTGGGGGGGGSGAAHPLTTDTTLFTADTDLLTADMTQTGGPPPIVVPVLMYPFLATIRGSAPQLYTIRVPAQQL